MTRRLWVIIGLGLVAVLVSGALWLDELQPVHEPQVAPSWGVYTDPQWVAMQKRFGSDVRMIASVSPMSVLEARGCLVVLHGTAHVTTICRPTAPLRVFAWRDGEFTTVVGVTSASVASVVTKGGGETSGAALMQVAQARVFASSMRTVKTLTAYAPGGRVLEQLRIYCASALRGSCGSSAQRRS